MDGDFNNLIARALNDKPLLAREQTYGKYEDACVYIATSRIDFGAPIEQVFKRGVYEVWKKRGSDQWTSNIRSYSPVWYALVKRGNPIDMTPYKKGTAQIYHYAVVKMGEPGKLHATYQAQLIAEAIRLHNEEQNHAR